jgi:molybdate transport system substrate-binding protein
MKQIAAKFEPVCECKVEVVSGSSGKLYAQIVNGAPFDVFLSADTERPLALEKGTHGVPGTRKPYALGRLALCGKKLEHPEDGALDLRGTAIEKLAIANPKLAPYGVAALDVLSRLGLKQRYETSLVLGESVGQVWSFGESGSADAAFVALSQTREAKPKHACWTVPEKLHAPIQQEAVQVSRKDAHPAAAKLLAFLTGADAQPLIEKAGYDVPTTVAGR